MGKLVAVCDAGRIVTNARVVTPSFYDPTGRRSDV
jgi:hypothetical protein